MSRGSTYPQDEFDLEVLPDDVPRGVHRAPRSTLSRWLPFIVIVVVCPLLAFGAVTWLNSWEGRPGEEIPVLSSDEEPDDAVEPTDPTGDGETTEPEETTEPTEPVEPTPEPEPEPEPDLARTVEVYNATLVSGLAGRAATALEDTGYTEVSSDNWPVAAPPSTTVFYPSAEDEATARHVAESLGITAVELDPERAGSAVVVVLTDGFEPPA